jgi:hypothetical protein
MRATFECTWEDMIAKLDANIASVIHTLTGYIVIKER